MAKQNEKESMLPMLAATALQGAGASNDQLQALVTEMLQDHVEKRRKEKDKKERMREEAIRDGQQRAAETARVQRLCTHRKQDNSTRLAGQKLTGTKQIAFVCLYCQKPFFMPADKTMGQEEPPRDLIPHTDLIGNL